MSTIHLCQKCLRSSPDLLIMHVNHLQKKLEIRDIIFKMIRHMVYVDYKDSAKRIASDKVLYDTTFEIANNPQFDRYQKEFVSMVHQPYNKR